MTISPPAAGIRSSAAMADTIAAESSAVSQSGSVNHVMLLVGNEQVRIALAVAADSHAIPRADGQALNLSIQSKCALGFEHAQERKTIALQSSSSSSFLLLANPYVRDQRQVIRGHQRQRVRGSSTPRSPAARVVDVVEVQHGKTPG